MANQVRKNALLGNDLTDSLLASEAFEVGVLVAGVLAAAVFETTAFAVGVLAEGVEGKQLGMRD